MGDEGQDLTRFLKEGAEGGQLFPVVYDELRRLADHHMGGERAPHTLQATALVHEAYLKLVRDKDMQWQDRRHFFGAAAEAMRRVLIDHARRAKADKRGGECARLQITLSGLQDESDPELVLALDDALTKLEEEDPRCAEVARLRFFAGLSNEDVAQALELSPRTITRDWVYGRARLMELLADGEG